MFEKKRFFPKCLKKLAPDKLTAISAIDRLVHHAEILELNPVISFGLAVARKKELLILEGPTRDLKKQAGKKIRMKKLRETMVPSFFLFMRYKKDTQ